MLFHFRLDPVETILERGYDDWYGLTDGEYWIDTGGGELFRYTPEAIAHFHRDHPAPPRPSPYNDYFVSRLWEDLASILPAAFEPVPAEVRDALPVGRAAWAWWRGVRERLPPDPAYPGTLTDEAGELLERGTRWQVERVLEAGYLIQGPWIWLWSDGERVHLRWDNRGCRVDGIPVWTAAEGTVSFSADAFLDEVRSFHERLIDAMKRQITGLALLGPRPDRPAALERLVEEHDWRAGALQRALARDRPATDWDGVLAAIHELKRVHPFGVD